MTTLLYSHPACLEHDTGPHHPERPDRLRAIETALGDPQFSSLTRIEAPRADFDVIRLVHPQSHIDALCAAEPKAAGDPLVYVDSDTVISHGSIEAALRSVGAAVDAVDRVMAGKAGNAFCATRPPGHHAGFKTAEGFCLFSNAAIAAKYSQAKHGAERIAVVDFDVHHGNGTQDIFWNERDLFYASTHQMPLYPGTGSRRETGMHDNIWNAPLSAGDGGERFREAWQSRILPALDNFGFDILIVSAGFDAHHRDPLGGLELKEDDFAWITQKLVERADRRCGGRVVSVLEGGYDLTGLAQSVAAQVAVLMSAGR
jgi:acetoin utilization deacetylase AcuC-like enzyme